MGISKLTAYMEDKENGPPRTIWTRKRLDHLVDGRLVIDGNNLCIWLYRFYPGLQAAALMGGPYQMFYQIVLRFFKTLEKYGVKPVVVFDGIKHDDEFEKARARKQEQITFISKYQRERGHNELDVSGLPPPIFLKEVFQDALQECDADVHLTAAAQEADAEMVAIANSFGCPLLSHDSDFYVHKISGGFIPLTHLDMSEECELKSPAVDVFLVDQFTRVFDLRDEDLRLLLPAVLGNDYIASAHLPIDLPDATTIKVGQVIEYARGFDSFQNCLQSAQEKQVFLYNNLRQARKQYKTPPPLSYPIATDHTCGMHGALARLPLQYHQRFRNGCFQNFMAAAVVQQRCMLGTIFEDVKAEGAQSAQSVSLPIRTAIYCILECKSPVSETRRGSSSALATLPIEVSNRPPITPKTMPRSTVEERRRIFLSVLKCGQVLVSKVPEEWVLPMAATTYWYSQARCKSSYVRALVACFVACHFSTNSSQVEGIMPPITQTPALERVHGFAQWQCVYFDAIALNQLLMEPFPYVSPAKLFDGEVAAYYHRRCNRVVENLRRKIDRDAEHLYTQLLEATGIIESEHKRSKKPDKKPSQPVTHVQNRFSMLAKMKDSKK